MKTSEELRQEIMQDPENQIYTEKAGSLYLSLPLKQKSSLPAKHLV